MNVVLNTAVLQIQKHSNNCVHYILQFGMSDQGTIKTKTPQPLF